MVSRNRKSAPSNTASVRPAFPPTKDSNSSRFWRDCEQRDKRKKKYQQSKKIRNYDSIGETKQHPPHASQFQRTINKLKQDAMKLSVQMKANAKSKTTVKAEKKKNENNKSKYNAATATAATATATISAENVGPRKTLDDDDDGDDDDAQPRPPFDSRPASVFKEQYRVHTHQKQKQKRKPIVVEKGNRHGKCSSTSTSTSTASTNTNDIHNNNNSKLLVNMNSDNKLKARLRHRWSELKQDVDQAFINKTKQQRERNRGGDSNNCNDDNNKHGNSNHGFKRAMTEVKCDKAGANADGNENDKTKDKSNSKQTQDTNHSKSESDRVRNSYFCTDDNIFTLYSTKKSQYKYYSTLSVRQLKQKLREKNVPMNVIENCVEKRNLIQALVTAANTTPLPATAASAAATATATKTNCSKFKFKNHSNSNPNPNRNPIPIPKKTVHNNNCNYNHRDHNKENNCKKRKVKVKKHDTGKCDGNSNSNDTEDEELIRMRVDTWIKKWSYGRSLRQLLNIILENRSKDKSYLHHKKTEYSVMLKAYRRAIMRIHPDRHVNSSFKTQYKSSEMFKVVTNLYDEYKAKHAVGQCLYLDS